MQLLTTKSCRPGGGVVLSKITDSNVRCWFWQTHPVLKLIWKNRTSFWENDQVREQFSHTFEKNTNSWDIFFKKSKKIPCSRHLKKEIVCLEKFGQKYPPTSATHPSHSHINYSPSRALSNKLSFWVLFWHLSMALLNGIFEKPHNSIESV